MTTASPSLDAPKASFRPERIAARRPHLLQQGTMLFALAAIWIFFAACNSSFLSSRNLAMLLIDLSITGVLALGLFVVIVPGHIDLSVGSGVGMLGGLAAVLVFEHRVPAPLAMLTALVLGVVLWCGMGAVIIKERIPAFIITLGGLLIFKGVHWLIIHNATIPVVAGGQANLYSLLTTWYVPPRAGYAVAAAVVAVMVVLRLRSRRLSVANGLPVADSETIFLQLFLAAQVCFLFVLFANQYRGIPLPALILGFVTAAIYVLTNHTRFGRYLYAIGGNEEAAAISGIPVQKVVILAFTITGAITAVTGLLQTAYGGASTTTVGSLMELDAIAACVIGGTSLRGGKGSVLGVILGALVMASLLNGMTLLAVSPEIKCIARGTVLALAVWMDVRFSSRPR